MSSHWLEIRVVFSAQCLALVKARHKMVTTLQQLEHPWDCSQARRHLCPSCYPLPVSKSRWPQANCLWEHPIISADSQTAWERAGRLGQSHRDCQLHTTPGDCPAVPRKVPGGCFVCWYQQQDLPRLALPGLSPASAPAALHQGVAASNRPMQGGDEGKQADFPPCAERQPPHHALMLSKLPRGFQSPSQKSVLQGKLRHSGHGAGRKLSVEADAVSSSLCWALVTTLPCQTSWG